MLPNREALLDLFSDGIRGIKLRPFDLILAAMKPGKPHRPSGKNRDKIKAARKQRGKK